jgi:hypothetical protein
LTTTHSKLQAMKTQSLFFTGVALLCSFFVLNVSSQTILIGHISAEVVETVSTSSAVSTDLELSSGNGLLLAEDLNLGSIHINSGQNVACNLNVKSTTLINKQGNDFSIESYNSTGDLGDSQQVDGSQTIQLAGRATLNLHQASGVYQGTYTLVVSYN